MHRLIAKRCCTGTTFVLAMALGSPPMHATEQAEDCDDYYYGIGRTKDLKRAFACHMRAPDENKDWMMLTVMHLNGEGTPASLAQAQAAFKHVSAHDASTEAMEKALVLRAAHPETRFPRLDFCKENQAASRQRRRSDSPW
jgi:hypothetical protein